VTILKKALFLALMPCTLFASAIYTEFGQKTYLNNINRASHSNYNYMRVLPRYYGESYSAYLDYQYFNNNYKDEGATKMEVGGQKTFAPWLTLDLALGKSSNHNYAPSFNLLTQVKSFIPKTKTSPYVAYIYESYKSIPVSRYHYYRLGAEQVLNTTYSLDVKGELIQNEKKKGYGVALDNFVNLNEKLRFTFGGLLTCLASDYQCNGKTVDQYIEASIGLNYLIVPSFAINSQFFHIIQESKSSLVQTQIKSRVLKFGMTYFF